MPTIHIIELSIHIDVACSTYFLWVLEHSPITTRYLGAKKKINYKYVLATLLRDIIKPLMRTNLNCNGEACSRIR